jgi:hypothetical protein
MRGQDAAERFPQYATMLAQQHLQRGAAMPFG